MKSLKYSFILILLLLIGSCDEDKYLDIYPLTSITEGNFYQSEVELQQALNDLYRQMGRVYSASNVVDFYGEMYSDNTNMIFIAGTGFDFEHINNHSILSDNARILTAWNICYNAIFICNKFIYELEKSTLPIAEATRNRMLGEALLIRSLIYFNMVRAWGDIPLITKVVSPLESYDYLREPVEKVYQQIITDLGFAKANLPGSYTGANVGRVTRYGAAGLLARVHMTLGNNPAARTELEFIINSGNFSLDANDDGVVNADDYFYLFAPGTKNCKESVLEVQFLAGTNAFNSNHQNTYTPFHHTFNLNDLGVPNSTFRGSGHNTPTPDLEAEYEEGDPRKEATIYPGYTHGVTGDFVEYPFTSKYFDPNWTNPGKNVYVIRYADILLMYAEVTNDATYLNMARERVGLPPYGSAEYPSDLYPNLALAIEHERRVELAFEFHRFFDLVRTGRALAVMQAKGYSNLNADRLLFPIPQHVIDINPGITQNPGY
jgi:starch-binding outer membrane protein, SusD/RagB family